MDSVDRGIISRLRLDGRISLTKLSEYVGYSSMGVKKRLDKLVKGNLLKVSGELNVEKLGLYTAIVFLEMDGSESMSKLLERFKDCPRVVYIFTTIGGYNLIAIIVAEDQSTLESISMERCSLRSAEGVRRSEFYPIGKIYYEPFLPVRQELTRRNLPLPPCGVDCRPCDSFRSNRCVGCPSIVHYRGKL